MKFEKTKKITTNILIIFLSWIVVTLYLFLFNKSHILFFNLITGALPNFYSYASNLSLIELKEFFPRLNSFVWFYLHSKWISFIIPLIIASFFYQRTINHRENIIRFSVIMIIYIILELISPIIITKIIKYPFNQNYINTNLILEQRHYSDNFGINRFINNKETANADYIINSEGFRSNYEFNKVTVDSLKKTSKVVMIIGDSHTEGCCARPITNSFADLLDKDEKFTVLNFGVGGTDPLQYKLIAEIFIEKLQPDYVIVAFCLGNDFMKINRKPKPNKTLYFQTNYNYLDATLPITHPNYSPDTYFSNWEEAKKFYEEYYTIQGLRKSSIYYRTMIKHSSFNSLLYYCPRYLRLSNTKRKNNSKEKGNKHTDISYKYIKEIEQLCKTDNIPFYLFGVPSIKDMNKKQDKVYLEYQACFRDIKLHYPKDIIKQDFVSDINDHFINSGHEKFYKFIKHEISK